MQLLKREAVLLALAPALGMLGVYAYESGRYRFLKVPSMLIDLPINRLLMGGVAIAVLVTLLLMVIGVLLKWMVGRSWFARFLTMFCGLLYFPRSPGPSLFNDNARGPVFVDRSGLLRAIGG
ncbi:hypothetical protein AASM09_08630 [Stenotrophomonas maltophilia]|uniref:hypothetical protein n=1 Tax=Stenotrophomonas maltophilia TaxID=40324 RepID=UPI0031CCBDAC